MKVFFTCKNRGKFVQSFCVLKIFCFLFIVQIFSFIHCYSQQFVSPTISPNTNISCSKEKVVAISNELDQSKKQKIFYFDGISWNTIQSNASPDLKFQEPNILISSFSESIFVPFKDAIWEYSNGAWQKYFIPDTFRNIRSYIDLIEMPDSSMLASTSITLEGSTYEKKIYQNELFTFKNGEFFLPRANRLAVDTNNNFSKVKKYYNGNFCYFTNRYSGKDSIWEYVLFDKMENPIVKFSIPVLDEQYVNAQVKLTDYLFDAKGSLWFLTSSKREFLLDSNGNKVLDTSGFVVFTHNFPGLIEIDSNKQIKYYNNNIGLDSSVYESLSFDIDQYDNIWFIYNHRFSFPENHFLPSMYRLDADRRTIKEFSIETMLKYSKIYNGGNQEEKFEYNYLHKKLKVNHQTGSIYIVTSKPLIEFFPDWIPASLNETSIIPIHLYPNPVQFDNTISIESRAFKNVINPLSVVIRDISGATVREETVSTYGNKLQVNIHDLLIGTYFVTVQSNNKTIVQTKFVKE